MLPDKISALQIAIGGIVDAGQLLKRSRYEFRYLSPQSDQPSVALLMPASAQLTWQDGDLFPVMDQNLPEGDLWHRLRAAFPKQPLTPMHLLALIGDNGIGRLGYRLSDSPSVASAPILTKEMLLNTSYTPEVFDDLVQAYLSTHLVWAVHPGGIAACDGEGGILLW